MTKRSIASGVVAVVVLGLAGAALANPSEQASYGVEEAALSLAADPVPGGPEAGKARREQLRACVKAKVDAGAQRPAAVKECADQLGVNPRRARRRAAHVELIVPKKGVVGQWETIFVDRGKVTAASAESISVQRPDGPTVTLKVTPATKVKGAASAAELAPGRDVMVVSAGGEARSIRAPK